MTETAEVVTDAEVVDDDAPSQELVHRPRRGEVLRPLDVAQQKDAMATYQRGLREILDASDWQDAGRGQKFVKKSGWRKIAAWFDLSIELIRDEVERDEESKEVTRACVWARAVAPSGRFADGDGYCDAQESRFNTDRGRQKLENDLRGTATTRAVNRAISNLVGMGAVSAEEIGPDPEPERPLGQPYDKKMLGKAVGAACVKLAGNDKQKGIALSRTIIEDCGGYLPQAAALALISASIAESMVPYIETPEPQ